LADYGHLGIEIGKQFVTFVGTAGVGNVVQMAGAIDAGNQQGNVNPNGGHTVTDAPAPVDTTGIVVSAADPLPIPLPTHQAPPPGGIVPEGSLPNPGAALVVSSPKTGILWVAAIAAVLVMAIVVKD